MTVRFVMVWVGDRYGPEYPAILHDMVVRNASQVESFTVECVTDHTPEELPRGVGHIPADPSIPPSYWAKVQLFSPNMPWEIGERVVYFDLDVCITGRLEDLVERKGIIKDWLWPGYNSSVMIWDHGEYPQIWLRFALDLMDRAPGPIVPPECLADGQINGGDQEWIAEVSEWPLLPSDWCVSYKHHAVAWPPHGAKVVCFPGWPKPHNFGGDGWARR